MLNVQNGVCAICGTSDPKIPPNKNGTYFSVDHCHATGKIRGLLCSSCNTALGGFKDSIPIMYAAISYLEIKR